MRIEKENDYSNGGNLPEGGVKGMKSELNSCKRIGKKSLKNKKQ
jgi:hypothetical protein